MPHWKWKSCLLKGKQNIKQSSDTFCVASFCIWNGFVNQWADFLACNCCSCTRWHSLWLPRAEPPPYVPVAAGAILAVKRLCRYWLEGWDRSYCCSQYHFQWKELGSMTFLILRWLWTIICCKHKLSESWEYKNEAFWSNNGLGVEQGVGSVLILERPWPKACGITVLVW